MRHPAYGVPLFFRRHPPQTPAATAAPATFAVPAAPYHSVIHSTPVPRHPQPLRRTPPKHPLPRIRNLRRTRARSCRTTSSGLPRSKLHRLRSHHRARSHSSSPPVIPASAAPVAAHPHPPPRNPPQHPLSSLHAPAENARRKHTPTRPRKAPPENALPKTPSRKRRTGRPHPCGQPVSLRTGDRFAPSLPSYAFAFAVLAATALSSSMMKSESTFM